eukprot:1031933-Prorocentrum_minimum.AAC.2
MRTVGVSMNPLTLEHFCLLSFCRPDARTIHHSSPPFPPCRTPINNGPLPASSANRRPPRRRRRRRFPSPLPPPPRSRGG